MLERKSERLPPGLRCRDEGYDIVFTERQLLRRLRGIRLESTHAHDAHARRECVGESLLQFVPVEILDALEHRQRCLLALPHVHRRSLLQLLVRLRKCLVEANRGERAAEKAQREVRMWRDRVPVAPAGDALEGPSPSDERHIAACNIDAFVVHLALIADFDQQLLHGWHCVGAVVR